MTEQEARSVRPGLVLGELVGDRPAVVDLPCNLPGVRARGTVTKHRGRTFEKRLYECSNGWALAARRGGPLHLADADSWEVVTMAPKRFTVGCPGGWVGEDQLLRLVARLSTWWHPAADREMTRVVGL